MYLFYGYNQINFFHYTFNMEDYKMDKKSLNCFFYLMIKLFSLNVQAHRVSEQQMPQEEQQVPVAVERVALPIARPTLDFSHGVGMHVFCDEVSHARAMFAAQVDRARNSQDFPSHQQILRMSVDVFPYGNEGRWAALIDGDNYVVIFSERPARHRYIGYHVYARPGTRVFESYSPAVQAELGPEYSQAYRQVTSQRIR